MDEQIRRNRTARPSQSRDQIDWAEIREELKEFIPAVYLILGIWAFEYFVGFDNVFASLKSGAKEGLEIGKNIVQWTAAALVALAACRILWPYVRPFVCMAVGLIAVWVMWRLGLF